MKNLICIISFVVSLGSLHACKDEYSICNLSKEVRFYGGFYQKVGADEIIAPAASLTIIQLDNAAVIYKKQQNISVFSLPLNSQVGSAQYEIAINNNLPKDTVTLTYTSTVTNLSPECGSVIYNNLTDVKTTNHTITSILVSKAIVNTDPLQNIKIYY